MLLVLSIKGKGEQSSSGEERYVTTLITDAKETNKCLAFFYFLAPMNFSYCCLFYGLGKIAKNGYVANFETLDFPYY